jgi:hypothetical protein
MQVFVVTHYTVDPHGDHVTVDSVHATEEQANARAFEVSALEGFGDVRELTVQGLEA